MEYLHGYIFFTLVSWCSGSTTHLTATRSFQHFTSPNYPENYNSDEHENWLISTQNTSEVIELKVIDSELEYSYSCAYDFVSIFDGGSTDDDVLKIFCGTSEPSIVSTGANVLVIFRTDDSVNRRGFRIKYWCTDKPEPSTPDTSYLSLIVSLAVLSGVSSLIGVVSLVYCCKAKKNRHDPRVTPTRVRGWSSRSDGRNLNNGHPRIQRLRDVDSLYTTNMLSPPEYDMMYPSSPPPPYTENDVRAAPH